MTFQIDPSKASIDFDCMTIDTYEVEDKNPQEDTARPITLRVHLSGGLGRVSIEGVGSKFFDEDIQVAADGLFLEMSTQQCVELTELVERWQTLNIPLRFLVFQDKAVILEDGDEFLVLPPGERRVTVGNADN